jgi:hypothetical protein
MPTREKELVPDGEIQKASVSPPTSHLPVLFFFLETPAVVICTAVVEKPLSYVRRRHLKNVPTTYIKYLTLVSHIWIRRAIFLGWAHTSDFNLRQK